MFRACVVLGLTKYLPAETIRFQYQRHIRERPSIVKCPSSPLIWLRRPPLSPYPPRLDEVLAIHDQTGIQRHDLQCRTLKLIIGSRDQITDGNDTIIPVRGIEGRAENAAVGHDTDQHDGS